MGLPSPEIIRWVVTQGALSGVSELIGSGTASNIFAVPRNYRVKFTRIWGHLFLGGTLIDDDMFMDAQLVTASVVKAGDALAPTQITDIVWDFSQEVSHIATVAGLVQGMSGEFDFDPSEILYTSAKTQVGASLMYYWWAFGDGTSSWKAAMWSNIELQWLGGGSASEGKVPFDGQVMATYV